MKHLFLWLLLFSFSWSAQAQFTSSLDAMIGVSQPFTQFSGIKNSDDYNQLPGWRIGINYHQGISDRFSLRLGVRLWVDNARLQVVDPSSQVSDPEENIVINLNNVWTEFPLAGRWYLGSGNWKPYLEAGIAPTVSFIQRSKWQPENGSESVNWSNTITVDDRMILVVGLVGGGVEYQARERLAFYASLLGRYFMNPLWNTNLINNHNGNVGLELGARFLMK
ncbi:MAG: hypothetical protein AAGH79_10895 [Bacteroidota bacterium]